MDASGHRALCFLIRTLLPASGRTAGIPSWGGHENESLSTVTNLVLDVEMYEGPGALKVSLRVAEEIRTSVPITH